MNIFETKLTKVIKETSDTYSFLLEIPQGYSWKAGQCAQFKFRDLVVKEGEKADRIFTIASTMEDGFIMFTTRIVDQPSAFKAVLLNEMKVGDTFLISAAMGKFDLHMNEFNQTYIVAGGIGITPIRALLKYYSQHNQENHQITLLYSDDRGEFAYLEFWKEVSGLMNNLTIHFISDRDQFTNSVNEFAKKNLNNSCYMIAGSPGMNKFFTENLINFGIEKDHIFTDNFMGL